MQLKEEQREASRAEKNLSVANTLNTASAKRKLSFKEQTEFKQLEKDIDLLNKEKTVLTEKLSGGSTDHNEIQKTAKRIEEIIIALDKKELRWLELSEFI